MTANGVRVFLAVARLGSFRRAGEALHIAASAVNRQVTLLEADIGAELFERSRGRNRLLLTAAGEIFLAHAKLATAQLDRAREQIEALKGLQSGSISIGVPETFTRDFLPEFLAEFHKTAPRVSFRLVVGNTPQIIKLLLADEIEIALAYNQKPSAAIHVAAKVDRPTRLMMHAGHPLAGRASVRLSDYAQHDVVLPSEGTSMWQFYEPILAKLPVKPRVVLVTSSYEMLRSAARVGLGLAIVNDYLVAGKAGATPDAVFVPILDPLIKPQELACCVRVGRRLPGIATVFIERLREALLAIA
ncbi:LysR family transcriptional regulator [soil metagenome]